MINDLVGIQDIDELVNILVNKFVEKIDGNYIPTIMEEGNIFLDDENIDFYSKLILLDGEKEVDTTWLANNFTGVNVYDFEDNKAINIITRKNYNHKELYQLNPVLVEGNEIWEKNPTNDVHLNQLLENYKGFEELPVFKYIKNESQKYLYLNKNTLESYTSFKDNSIYLTKYIVCLEFEMRYKNDLLKLQEYKGKISKTELITDGFIDIFNSSLSEIKNYSTTTIQGTIALDFTQISFNHITTKQNIKVVNLDDKKIRDLDMSNYNDDTDAGLVVFDKRIIEILDKEYVYTGTYLQPKRKDQRGVIIDELEDVIVFWEGEFNKFPIEIIDKIQPFNLSDRTTNIISEMMYAWQLAVDWNYLDKGLPSQQLGSYTYENKSSVAFQYEVNFWQTDTIDLLKKFLINMERLYDVTPFYYSDKSIDIQILKNIYENVPIKEEVDPCVLMQKYSYALLKYLGVK